MLLVVTPFFSSIFRTKGGSPLVNTADDNELLPAQRNASKCARSGQSLKQSAVTLPPLDGVFYIHTPFVLGLREKFHTRQKYIQLCSYMGINDGFHDFRREYSHFSTVNDNNVYNIDSDCSSSTQKIGVLYLP